ncbi:hypothetical protein VTJ04DRAFT_3178 [Mycothermus thermophilus]|uniref:uncharacterized protein n=1 Tax=Humicola insolens TaxID=85995 RepID=UPI003742F68E
MSSCSLGVRALRPSVQAAVHHVTKHNSNKCLLAPFSTRCAAPWTSSFPQHSQLQIQRQTARLQTPPPRPRPALPPWLGFRTLIGTPSVITHYVDLPPNYTDEEGLPFAKRDLEAYEVLEIFGPSISTPDANKLLRILHGRRVAGTLDDPQVKVNTKRFSAKHQEIALEYLRRKVPVDEVINAGLRAEDELAALEGGAIEEADAEWEEAQKGGKAVEAEGEPTKAGRLKLYKEENQDSPKPTKPDPSSVYGKSALDEIRAINKAKWEALLKKQEEERKKREEEERYGKAGPLAVAGERQTRQLSPKMQEYIARATSDLKEPPKMTWRQRIGPSALLVLGVTGICLAFAEFYRPPKRDSRLFPDIPPAAATVGTLIIANLLGWVLWKVPPMWAILNRHFLIVPATPRAFSMFGALFSHQSFMHFLQNMIVLWFMGVRLHDEIGRGPFLATYFTSGTMASLGTLTWAVLRSRFDITSLGASGAIYGIGAAYLWMHRFDYFKVLGLPPPPSEGVQGMTLLALAVALNIGALFTAKRFSIDITSHMVGTGVGIASAYVVEKRREMRTQPTKTLSASKA